MLFAHDCTVVSHSCHARLLLSRRTWCAGPGSFLQVTKVLPFLMVVSTDHPSFHVVAPSLPGYKWSDGVVEKGLSCEALCQALIMMISLVYNEDVMQGGDWGHALTLTTASIFGPKHVKASHMNIPM
ncbi:hypothetical protein BJY52DRAFT_1121725 [Lactarius psammicola]|nr:hypothetical protein BJY52DRAFT_1121725 [Lactarius psammicola]